LQGGSAVGLAEGLICCCHDPHNLVACLLRLLLSFMCRVAAQLVLLKGSFAAVITCQVPTCCCCCCYCPSAGWQCCWPS
jgi:hypothetical protein